MNVYKQIGAKELFLFKHWCLEFTFYGYGWLSYIHNIKNKMFTHIGWWWKVKLYVLFLPGDHSDPLDPLTSCFFILHSTEWTKKQQQLKAILRDLLISALSIHTFYLTNFLPFTKIDRASRVDNILWIWKL